MAILNLPDVTLMAIDCVNPGRTLKALYYSSNLCNFGDIILLTDTKRWSPDFFEPKIKGLRTIHHVQGADRMEYELAVHREPIKHLKTPFMLFSEWDSSVLNPLAWDDFFLEFDYIGAPWIDHNDPGFPACDDSNRVGNGGFALKSARWCQVIAELSINAHDTAPQRISDSWACRTMRDELKKRGIEFADEATASRFSCENRIYTGQFGYHGKTTMAMNGWGIKSLRDAYAR